ncbi:MAG: response regulator [Phycisphaerales bacterium]|nr:MAG: response regulator [Phycisphaerales bacterium]
MPELPQRILIVDDEPEVRSVLADVLTDGDHRCCATCSSGAEALLRLGHEAFDVVLADVCMPGMDGMTLLDSIVSRAPHPKVIVMTGAETAKAARHARRRGAFEFVRKPFDVDDLRRLVDKAAKRNAEGVQVPTDHDAPFADQEEQRTVWKFMPDSPGGQAERKSFITVDVRRQLQRLYVESIRALVAAVEAKDPYTEKHSVVVSYYCEIIAGRLGLPPEQIETLKMAAILHDIGKIGIPDAILQKPGPLTGPEFEIVKEHPKRALQILGHASFLTSELPLILHHHERYDGKGYPDGIRGEEAPLGARILSVADSIDTMLTARSYKPSGDVEYVKRELAAGAGHQFDPQLARIAIDWLSSSPGDIVVHPLVAGTV